MHGIYEIKNKINNKVYIGQSKNIEERLKQHMYQLENNKDSKHLQRAWKKYGEENFEFNVIETVDNINSLDEREIYWIKYRKSTNREYGYNLREGGNRTGFCEETRKLMSLSAKNKPPISDETRMKLRESNKNRLFSEETKRKLRESAKGRKLSQETKNKISKSHKGRKPHNLGIPMSNEQKDKLSKAMKGRKHSDESKKKMSESKKGIKFTDERKKNMKGFQNKHTEETKEKISKSKKGKPSWNTGKSKIDLEIQQKIIEDFKNKIDIKEIMLKYQIKIGMAYKIKNIYKNGAIS